MEVRLVEGDLLEQDTDVIVNAWNRNVIPWWLLLPQGVSGAIKRRAGRAVFSEVARCGPIPLGGAVHTSAGALPHRGIIHVAGIDLLWRASESSIRDSVRSAVALAIERGYRTMAMPIVGAGSGGFDEARAEALILETLDEMEADLAVTVVRYRRGS